MKPGAHGNTHPSIGIKRPTEDRDWTEYHVRRRRLARRQEECSLFVHGVKVASTERMNINSVRHNIARHLMRGLRHQFGISSGWFPSQWDHKVYASITAQCGGSDVIFTD